MFKTSEEIYNISGITCKGNSFLDVITIFFESHEEFSRCFVDTFLEVGEEDLSSVYLLTKNDIVFPEMKKTFPDLVLFSQELQKLALININIIFDDNDPNTNFDHVDVLDIKENLNLENAKEEYYKINIVEKSTDEWLGLTWTDVVTSLSFKDGYVKHLGDSLISICKDIILFEDRNV